MADLVAVISVASSGAVALGGLVVTYLAGREQRSHEARQAFEARAWELKSEGLLSVITACRLLVDTINSPDQHTRDTLGVNVNRALESLDDAVPVVETYGSDDCRQAIDALRSLLGGSTRDRSVEARVMRIRQLKEQAIDVQDFDAALALRGRERTALSRSTAKLTVTPEQISQAANNLIEAARRSLKG